MVESWWDGHGFPAVPASFLPKFGLVAFFPDKQAAAGWLYMDNSTGVSMLEWLVSNPACNGRETLKAINELTKFFKERAAAMNYGVMLTTCRQASLAKLHERNGFTITDRNMIHLVATTQ